MPSIYNHENACWGIRRSSCDMFQYDLNDEFQTNKSKDLVCHSNQNNETQNTTYVHYSVSSNGYYGYQPHKAIQVESSTEIEMDVEDISTIPSISPANDSTSMFRCAAFNPDLQSNIVRRKRQMPCDYLDSSKRIRQEVNRLQHDPEALKRWKNRNINLERENQNENEETVDNENKEIGPSTSRDPLTTPRLEQNTSGALPGTPPLDLVPGPQDGRPTSEQDQNETNSLSSCSFETLLLSTIKQEKPFAKKKKTKVAIGAEVITSPTAIKEREEQESQEKKRKLKNSETKPKGLNLPKKKKAAEESAKQEVKKITKPNQKKPLRIKKEGKFNKRGDKFYYEDTESEDDPVSVSDSDDDIITLDDLKSDMEEADDYELVPAGDVENKKTGDWVLVEFCPGKSSKKKHYIGLITDISDGTTSIKYLRKKDHASSAFIWPEIDDVEYFDTNEGILAVLPQPTPGRRGEIIFPLSFDSYNIQ